MKKKGEWLEVRIEKRAGGTDQLAERLNEYIYIPPNFLRKLERQNGIRAEAERVMLRIFPPEPLNFSPEWLELDVVYEDDLCLVVNKPPGLAVHPAVVGAGESLANKVAAYYQSTGQPLAVRHIHRLDENTSGPVLYAKNEFAQSILDEAMRNKRIERIYIAVVEGRMDRLKGKLDYPIGKDRHHHHRRRVSATGSPAVTHYEVIELYNNATLVRLSLETGRTHQIRVHLSHIGHPIAGDALYRGSTKLISRQALHGERLIFPDPLHGGMIEAICPIPGDMKRLLEQIGKNKKI